jgi:hypothetical protein
MAMYSLQFNNVAVTAAQDFFELVAATSRPIKIHAIFLAQTTDLGDAAEEILRVLLIRGHTTSGSGGSTPSSVPLRSGMAASVATAFEANNTTAATGGSPVTCHADAFNIRGGWVYVPTPECRIEVAGGERFVVNLPSAPADSLTMSGTLIFEEA